MAKQKNGSEGGKTKRGETEQARCWLRKAKRIAKSNGKPTLERYLGMRSSLRTYFPREVASIIANARVIKPKVSPEAATA